MVNMANFVQQTGIIILRT